MSAYHNDLNNRETAAEFLLDQLGQDPKNRVSWTPNLRSESLKKWIRSEKPDVVICQENSIIPELRSEGFRVPEDFGVIHLNLCSDVSGWAGIDQNHQAIGMASINLVVGQINRNERGVPLYPMEVTLPSRWIDGWTLPAKMSLRPIAINFSVLRKRCAFLVNKN